MSSKETQELLSKRPTRRLIILCYFLFLLSVGCFPSYLVALALLLLNTAEFRNDGFPNHLKTLYSLVFTVPVATVSMVLFLVMDDSVQPFRAVGRIGILVFIVCCLIIAIDLIRGLYFITRNQDVSVPQKNMSPSEVDQLDNTRTPLSPPQDAPQTGNQPEVWHAEKR